MASVYKVIIDPLDGSPKMVLNSVGSLNGLQGPVSLIAGANITLVVTGSSIEITAAGGGGGGVTLVGTYGSVAPSANGLSISGTSIFAQSASTTNPGMVDTGVQSFKGKKTFGDQVTFGTNLVLSSAAGIATIKNPTTGSTLTLNNTVSLVDNSTTGLHLDGLGNATIDGTIAASNLSGTNTGDQTITLTGNVTGSGTGSFATTIAANAVANSMLAQMATLTIKGNNTGLTANAADLTVAQVMTMLSLSGVNTGDQTITLTGNVTGSGTGSFATTIANGAITNIMFSSMAAYTVKANITGAGAAPTDVGLVTSNTPNTAVLRDANGNFSGSVTYPFVIKTSAYAIAYTDSVIQGDTTSGAFALTLPTAVGNVGKWFLIKRISDGPYNLTVNTTSSQTIDGALTAVIINQWDAIFVISDGANWGLY